MRIYNTSVCTYIGNYTIMCFLVSSLINTIKMWLPLPSQKEYHLSQFHKSTFWRLMPAESVACILDICTSMTDQMHHLLTYFQWMNMISGGSTVSSKSSRTRAVAVERSELWMLSHKCIFHLEHLCDLMTIWGKPKCQNGTNSWGEIN